MHCRILCALILAGGLFGQADRITGDRIRPHVRFLSHDLLEGRGPGTRGGALTEQYLAAQFEAAGLKRDFGDRLAFHGAIDTHATLPLSHGANSRNSPQGCRHCRPSRSMNASASPGPHVPAS